MSGIQPTGIPHLGNYFGAIQQWIHLKTNPDISRIFLSIVDLHSLTPFKKPINISENVYRMAASLIACGLSGDKISMFQQSKILHHTNLSWMLMSICPISRVQIMPQWKENLENWPGDELPNAGLLMYPILQAADILLYAPDIVPVGDDQVIHLNLARYLRSKLIHWESVLSNSNLEQYLPVPQMTKCPFPKIFSLKTIGKKMSKSDATVDSRIELSDTPDQISSKIKKALTDSTSKTITYDMGTRPALANLINIYCALKGLTPELAISEIGQLSKCQFKELLADEIIRTVEPIRMKTEELLKNRDEIDEILRHGHDSAIEKANETMTIISKHIGIKS